MNNIIFASSPVSLFFSPISCLFLSVGCSEEAHKALITKKSQSTLCYKAHPVTQIKKRNMTACLSTFLCARPVPIIPCLSICRINCLSVSLYFCVCIWICFTDCFPTCFTCLSLLFSCSGKHHRNWL